MGTFIIVTMSMAIGIAVELGYYGIAAGMFTSVLMGCMNIAVNNIIRRLWSK
jgi:hypothetical protein